MWVVISDPTIVPKKATVVFEDKKRGTQENKGCPDMPSVRAQRCNLCHVALPWWMVSWCIIHTMVQHLRYTLYGGKFGRNGGPAPQTERTWEATQRGRSCALGGPTVPNYVSLCLHLSSSAVRFSRRYGCRPHRRYPTHMYQT